MNIKELSTPFYLFDEKVCQKKAYEIKEYLEEFDGKLCYAIKSNPFLIPSLENIVDKFEVCSPGELEICRKYQVSGEKILFSGVIKSKEDIQRAIQYPVDIITLESLQHWNLLKENILQLDNEEGCHKIKVVPRLTSGAQFGMVFDEIQLIAEESKLIPQVDVVGLHYFTGTQKKKKLYEKELELVAPVVEKLKNILQKEDFFLEYGPGLAVPYFEGDDFANIYGLLESLTSYIINKNYSFRIDIELGRFVAASCGQYYTSIVDCKNSGVNQYCMIDGGIHHINYYGSNMAMRTPKVHHYRLGEDGNFKEEKDNQEEQSYMVCGSLCTFADVVLRSYPLKKPKIGDRLVFDNVGAYSITEGSYLFLSRDLPAVYMKRENSIDLLRKGYNTYEINSRDL